MPDKNDGHLPPDKPSKVTSIVEARERKTWERLRSNALEALVESADFSRGLESTDFEEMLADLEDTEDESAPAARAQLRCARGLRSCLRGDVEGGFAEWEQVMTEAPDLALPYVVRARWRMKTDPATALPDLDR